MQQTKTRINKNWLISLSAALLSQIITEGEKMGFGGVVGEEA